MAYDLGQIGASAEFQSPEVGKDGHAIVAPRDKDACVVQQGDVIATAGGRLASRRLRLPLEGHEIEQENVLGVCLAVVATEHEEIGADLGRGVGEAIVADFGLDQGPREGF